MNVNASVSIRGSRSSRQVRRDASQHPPLSAKPYPFARLMVQHGNGSGTSYELTYTLLPNGEIVVSLDKQAPGELSKNVYADRITRLAGRI